MKIEDLTESFEEYYEHWADQHERMTRMIEFCRNGDQWDEDIKRDREREARPCLTSNKLPSFAKQVINDARQNKPSVRTAPVDDNGDPKTANVLNGLFRNIEYISDAETCYDTALENAVYTGWGFWEVTVDYSNSDTFEQDIMYRRILDSTKVYPDPYSEASDASDWTRCFVQADPISLTEFEKNWPKKDPSNALSKCPAYNDLPDDQVLLITCWDRKEVPDQLIQLSDGAVMYYSEYVKRIEDNDPYALSIQIVRQRECNRWEVTKYLFSGSDVLEEERWPGRYIPIIPVYGEDYIYDGERKFKGMFDDAVDAQRMYNYWRTANTETVALQPKAPYVGAVGQFNTDARRWSEANTANHAYLEYDPVQGADRPRREPPPMLSQGALSEVMAADQDMKDIIGIQQSALGQESREIAGVAIQAKKEEGDTSNFHFIDNLKRGIRYCGVVTMDLIRHVYSDARVIRVIGADGESQSVAINGQREGYNEIYNITAGKYDVVVEMGAGYTTKRKEAVANMMQLLTAFPQMSTIIGDLVAKNMDWDGADEIAKRLKVMLPPAVAAMDDLGGVPDEAKPYIAQAQNATKQLQDQIQQKDMIVSSMEQQLKQYDIELRNKKGEQQTKVLVQQMSDQSKKEIEAIKAGYDKQLEVVKGEVKAQLEQVNFQMSALTDLMNNQINV